MTGHETINDMNMTSAVYHILVHVIIHTTISLRYENVVNVWAVDACLSELDLFTRLIFPGYIQADFSEKELWWAHQIERNTIQFHSTCT